jgi:aspartyl-tRNA(Asn)/glutamyl-tRNA(Gln) amidotransferase subunit C
MSLTPEEVRSIARLARIEITDQEAAAAQGQLNNIFRLIEQMQAVDTGEATPMAHARDVSQRFREDVVTEIDRHSAFQAISPQVAMGLYLVPKVIE